MLEQYTCSHSCVVRRICNSNQLYYEIKLNKNPIYHSQKEKVRYFNQTCTCVLLRLSRSSITISSDCFALIEYLGQCGRLAITRITLAARLPQVICQALDNSFFYIFHIMSLRFITPISCSASISLLDMLHRVLTSQVS